MNYQHMYRFQQAFLCLVTLMVIGASFYLQYEMGMHPCPLCLMQRFCAIVLGFLFFAGIWGPYSRYRWGLFGAQLLFAAGGLLFAARQLWLQSLPVEQASACMPTLEVLIQSFPWQDVVHALFWGSGSCADSAWQGFGLSMPAWALIYFGLMVVDIIFLQASMLIFKQRD